MCVCLWSIVNSVHCTQYALTVTICLQALAEHDGITSHVQEKGMFAEEALLLCGA